jgi:drug/metabolite transporter (DMT)-like permease
MAMSVAAGAVTARTLLAGLLERPALIGIASGTFFALSAVAYRGAALSLGGEGFWMQAAFTLGCATVIQTVAMTLYLMWRQPGQVTRAMRAWRVAAVVGLTGMLASACWFTAMTIENAAHVRAVGQIELVFTFLASYLFFKERSTALEILGISLVAGGIVMLLVLR